MGFNPRAILLFFFLAIILGLAIRWLYLAYKVAKAKENKLYNQVNAKIDAMETQTNGQDTTNKGRTQSKNNNGNKKAK
jgi:hypothetical protein